MIRRSRRRAGQAAPGRSQAPGPSHRRSQVRQRGEPGPRPGETRHSGPGTGGQPDHDGRDHRRAEDAREVEGQRRGGGANRCRKGFGQQRAQRAVGQPGEREPDDAEEHRPRGIGRFGQRREDRPEGHVADRHGRRHLLAPNAVGQPRRQRNGQTRERRAEIEMAPIADGSPPQWRTVLGVCDDPDGLVRRP